MKLFEEVHETNPIINTGITSMGVFIDEFQDSRFVQLSILDSSYRTDVLRKTVYNIKDKFGYEKIQHASEIQDTPVLKDVIGFGSVKDLL